MSSVSTIEQKKQSLPGSFQVFLHGVYMYKLLLLYYHILFYTSISILYVYAYAFVDNKRIKKIPKKAVLFLREK